MFDRRALIQVKIAAVLLNRVGTVIINRFEVRKKDLETTRVYSVAAADLADGEVLCRIDRFALTANNITYGVVGERLGYWKFFPTDADWGVIPVWGFADVIKSAHPDIVVGERLYGYFPMATHLVMRPDNISTTRLFDGSPHRAQLPAVYNAYARTISEFLYDSDMESERMLLLPLYATSFCLADYLLDNAYFGASQVVVLSASSKTAIGLAYALSDAGARSVALTSKLNLEYVSRLDLYQQSFSYENLHRIDSSKPTVIVDMSGNGTVLSDLHGHLNDNMLLTSAVGITHFDASEKGDSFIAERTTMFFAPSHIQKRAEDWGAGEFEKRSFEFWHAAAIRSRSWLHIDERIGIEALKKTYFELLRGAVSPQQGLVVRL